jgi:hypothetical protein
MMLTPLGDDTCSCFDGDTTAAAAGASAGTREGIDAPDGCDGDDDVDEDVDGFTAPDDASMHVACTDGTVGMPGSLPALTEEDDAPLPPALLPLPVDTVDAVNVSKASLQHERDTFGEGVTHGQQHGATPAAGEASRTTRSARTRSRHPPTTRITLHVRRHRCRHDTTRHEQTRLARQGHGTSVGTARRIRPPSQKDVSPSGSWS